MRKILPDRVVATAGKAAHQLRREFGRDPSRQYVDPFAAQAAEDPLQRFERLPLAEHHFRKTAAAMPIQVQLGITDVGDGPLRHAAHKVGHREVATQQALSQVRQVGCVHRVHSNEPGWRWRAVVVSRQFLSNCRRADASLRPLRPDQLRLSRSRATDSTLAPRQSQTPLKNRKSAGAIGLAGPTTMSRHETRRSQLRKLLRAAGADSLLVTNFTNVTYLTGFTGDDSYLLVGPKDTILVSDPRYTTQLEEECPDITVSIRPPGKSMLDGVAEAVRSAKVSNLAIEADAITVGLFGHLETKLAKTKLVPASGVVEQLRVIKDKQEIEEIEVAARYAEKGFAILRATLRPERTEKEVAADLGISDCGSWGRPVAASRRSSPSGPARRYRMPSQPIKKSATRDFVLVDWGATARHYKSDLTRVLVTGKISPKLERVYNVVLKAQVQAIAAIKPGLTGREVDAVARGIIADAGFGRHFGHGLGHGLGLDIHEAPRLAAGCRAGSQAGHGRHGRARHLPAGLGRRADRR